MIDDDNRRLQVLDFFEALPDARRLPEDDINGPDTCQIPAQLDFTHDNFYTKEWPAKALRSEQGQSMRNIECRVEYFVNRPQH